MFDHFDLIAPLYDRSMGKTPVKRMKSVLRLPADGWLLDAGGGTGRVSNDLRDWVAHCVVCDTSLAMLRQSRRKKGLIGVRSPIENLPFQDRSFDRVIVVDALHHFADQVKALNELIRILKPGGRLLIEEPDVEQFVVKMVALAEKLFLMRSHFRTSSDIRHILLQTGVTVEIKRRDRFRYWIVAQK